MQFKAAYSHQVMHWLRDHPLSLVSHCRGTGIRQSALLPLQQHFRLSRAILGCILTSNDAMIKGYPPNAVSHCRGMGIRQSALLVLQLQIRLLHLLSGRALTLSNALAVIHSPTTVSRCRGTGIRQSALLPLLLHIGLLHVDKVSIVTSSKAQADVQLTKFRHCQGQTFTNLCLTLQGRRDQAVSLASTAAALQAVPCRSGRHPHVKQCIGCSSCQ